jgi:hypothetical protein
LQETQHSIEASSITAAKHSFALLQYIPTTAESPECHQNQGLLQVTQLCELIVLNQVSVTSDVTMQGITAVFAGLAAATHLSKLEMNLL